MKKNRERTIKDLPRSLSGKLNMIHDILCRAQFDEDQDDDSEAVEILIKWIEGRKSNEK